MSATKARTGFEVHAHSYIAGPYANGGGYSGSGVWITSNFEHSHEDGDVPHTHPDTGPSCYTIDKDEWARATGMKGGGRKKYTKQPTGPQMPFIARTEAECTFEVIFANPPNPGPGYPGSEPKPGKTVAAIGGISAIDRIAQTFRMTPVLRIER